MNNETNEKLVELLRNANNNIGNDEWVHCFEEILEFAKANEIKASNPKMNGIRWLAITLNDVEYIVEERKEFWS